MCVRLQIGPTITVRSESTIIDSRLHKLIWNVMRFSSTQSLH